MNIGQELGSSSQPIGGLFVWVTSHIHPYIGTRGCSGQALFIFSCLILFTCGVHAAQWAKTYGGIGDYANSVQLTADDGYIVAGVTQTGAVSVLRIDKSGNIIWQKTYSGTHGEAVASSVQLTADGGYVVAGYTNSFSTGLYDAWLLKLDAEGNVIWQKGYGDAVDHIANSVQGTIDGGYIVAGTTNPFASGVGHAWLVKLDAGGNVVWQKTYGGTRHDSALSAKPTSDGGYIVAGETLSFGVQSVPGGIGDAWVFKLDASGNVMWQKTFGGEGIDWANSVQPTADGGYIVAATTDLGSTPGNFLPWILKLDAAGNVIWQKTYGTGAGIAYSVLQATDGGYIVTGFLNLSILILKLDAGGNVIWLRGYGDTNGGAQAYSTQLTADDGYIVAGIKGVPLSIQPWVLKLGNNGAINGCAEMTPLDATPSDTNATVGNSSATGVAGDATPLSTTAVALNSTAMSQQQCYYDASSVVATEVPTLSGWIVILMSTLLGLSATATMRRDERHGSHI